MGLWCRLVFHIGLSSLGLALVACFMVLTPSKLTNPLFPSPSRRLLYNPPFNTFQSLVWSFSLMMASLLSYAANSSSEGDPSFFLSGFFFFSIPFFLWPVRLFGVPNSAQLFFFWALSPKESPSKKRRVYFQRYCKLLPSFLRLYLD